MKPSKSQTRWGAFVFSASRLRLQLIGYFLPLTLLGCSPSVAPEPEGPAGLLYIGHFSLPQSSITIVDLQEEQIVGSVILEGGLIHLAITPDRKFIYASFPSGPSKVDVIDTRLRQVIRSVTVPGIPQGIAASLMGHEAYVAMGNAAAESPNALAILEPLGARIRATIPLGESPHWVAVDNNGLAYVTIGGVGDRPLKLAVVDLGSLRVTRSMEIGPEGAGGFPRAAIALVPQQQRILVCTRDSQGPALAILEIGDLSQKALLSLGSQENCVGIAVSGMEGFAFIRTADRVVKVDVGASQIVGFLDARGRGIATDFQGTKIYTTDAFLSPTSGLLKILDGRTLALIKEIDIPFNPLTLVLAP